MSELKVREPSESYAAERRVHSGAAMRTVNRRSHSVKKVTQKVTQCREG